MWAQNGKRRQGAITVSSTPSPPSLGDVDHWLASLLSQTQLPSCGVSVNDALLQDTVSSQSYTAANRLTVSGYLSTKWINSAACALGLARPCSQFSSVRGLVRR